MLRQHGAEHAVAELAEHLRALIAGGE